MMSLSIKPVKNYKNWGWDAWVLKNNWVTLTAVPVIGGRIMEYALSKISWIYKNPDLLGKIYTPAPEQDWPNFGGYKVWPAPQKAWEWPPPPTLDHGLYEAEIKSQTEESVTLLLRSPVEQWKAPGIQFERHVTLKHNSTKVQIQETLVNKGDEDVSWSIWDVTQNIVNHPGKENYNNFYVYFPIHSKSRYGTSGVYYTKDSKAWQGEVAPGIYGVQCYLDGQKIFSDSHEGWIGYSDLKKQLVYTKTFPNYHGKSYPDNEAHMAVYLNNSQLPYLEMEVMGPIIELAPGDETSFFIDWGIAHASAPILDVNDIGIVTQHLVKSKGRLMGKYGVFYEGSVYLVFRDMRGVMLKKIMSQPVSPLKPVIIDQSVTIDSDVRLIEVQVNGHDGHTIGVLDDLEI